MKYYQDITIIPCYEISNYHIWEKLFQQIHLAIVETESTDDKFSIGIAFPKYKYTDKYKTLGNILRIFAKSEVELRGLDLEKWLKRLSDYVHVKRIRNMPDELKGYSSFWSPQPKSNIERLARRKAKREEISFDEALKKLKGFKEQVFDFPYINCKSLSRKESFKKFIKVENADILIDKGFNSYGLSRESSLPNF